jgi:hypothetical protein
MSALVDELRAADALTKPLVYTISVGSDGGFIEAVSLADYEAAVDTLQSRLEAVKAERDAILATSAAYNATEREGRAIMDEAAALARAEAAEARVEELQKALKPFSDMGGEMFARGWDASNVALALDNPNDAHRVTAGDFFRARAGIASYEGETGWRPIETAPKDGRWIIAVCNNRVSVHRISWGRNRDGQLGWCEADGFLSYGDGLFSPNGGWTPCPQPRALFPARTEEGKQ